MQIKLFQNYNPKKPVKDTILEKTITNCWKIVDDFFDFKNHGFKYENKSNSDINSNKAIEENTIAIWLLIDKVDFSKTKLSTKNLVKTIDIILNHWNNEKGVPAIFSKEWVGTSAVPDVAKFFDLTLAVLKVCKITGDKKYMYSLIDILKFVNKYKLNNNTRLYSKNTNGNISWSSIKYVLLLNEINSFFNIDEFSGMYEPELSKVLLKTTNNTYIDFKEQIKLEAFNTIQELKLNYYQLQAGRFVNA